MLLPLAVAHLKIVTHAPTTEWGEQSYSVHCSGFPAAVTLHENRLWLAGTVRHNLMVYGLVSQHHTLTLM